MKTPTLFWGLLLGGAALAVTSGQAQTNTYQDDALYVRFKRTAAPKLPADTRTIAVGKTESLVKMQSAYGLHKEMTCMRTLGQPVLERTFMIRLDSTGKIERLLAELQQEDQIELVERVPVYYLQGNFAAGQSEALPAKDAAGQGDPYYESGSLSSASSWHLNMIHAEEAWSRQQGNANVKVAVVDNAVWGEHPDLQIKPENQYNVRSGQEGNSAPPVNVQQNTNCTDANNCAPYNWSHGTHCAGAVGAIRGNGIGIASIGSGVTLMGVSCPGTDPSGLAVSNAFQGVSWAASHGAKVISLSWGNYSISQTERAIIQACIDNGIVVVAAAGNNGYKDAPMYPANLPGVISVGSVDNNKQISSFSNNGDWVCIAAPGGKIIQNGTETQGCIFSTTYCTSQRYRLGGHSFANGQNYDGMFGTSMATPVVSGLCGLLLSADSTIDPYLMREILVSTAQPLTATAGKNFAPNSGIIDAGAAIRLDKVNVPRVRNLTAERQDLNVILRWEKPQSEKTVKAYQVFSNNVFLAEVPNQELSYTQEIGKSEALYHYGVRVIYDNDTSLRAGVDLAVPDLFDIEATVQPAGCGTVTGTGIFATGDTARLKAKATDGCTFSRWMEESEILGRDTVLDYVIGKADVRLRAIFSGKPSANSVFEQTLSVNVYPNPTSGKFSIDMEGEDNLVEIFSLDGTLVDRHEHVGNRIEVSLTGTGTYLIRISNRNGNAIRKIVVK